MFPCEKCPKCGSQDISQAEVDIGVGIQYGPASCNSCGWSQDDDSREALKNLGMTDPDIDNLLK